MRLTGMAWLLACMVAVGACSKQDSAKTPGTTATKAPVPAAATAAEREAEPVFVDGVTFSVVDGPAGGKELRYEGMLHNNSAKPVDGVELSISLVNAGGASVGGQVSQNFFQPPVQPKGTQTLLVQLPALKVKDDFSTLSAKIVISKVLKAQPVSTPAPPATASVITPPVQGAALGIAGEKSAVEVSAQTANDHHAGTETSK